MSRLLNRFLLGGFGLLLALLATLLMLGSSQSTTRWLAEHLQETHPELSISEPRGSLLGGVSIDALSWHSNSLVLDFTELNFSWQSVDLLFGRLTVDTLSVKRLAIQTLGPSSQEALVLPTVMVPALWSIQQLELDVLRVNHRDFVEQVRLSAHGYGQRITLDALQAQHGEFTLTDGRLDLRMHKHWPLTGRLVPGYRGQHFPLELSGDLSALIVHSHAEADWPVVVTAEFSVLDKSLPYHLKASLRTPYTLADFTVQQLQITATGDRFDGTIQPVATVTNAAQLKASSPWLEASAKIRYRVEPAHWTLQLDGAGSHAKQALQIRGRVDSQALAKTRLSVQSGQDILQANGWLADGQRLQAKLDIAELSRWLPGSAGRLALQATWQGAPESGHGVLTSTLERLMWQEQLFADRLVLQASGSRQHQLELSWRRKQQAGTMSARGLWQNGHWQGELVRWDLLWSEAVWRLQSPTELTWSEQQWAMQKLCMEQVRADIADWQLCGELSEGRQDWALKLSANLGEFAKAKAQFSRSKNREDNVISGDIEWQLPDLSKLPFPLPTGLIINGQSDGDLRITGTLAKPEVLGRWQISSGQVRWPIYGIDWSELAIAGEMNAQRTEWSGRFSDHGQGQMAWYGQAHWGESWRLLSRFHGQGLQLRYPPWFDGHLDPDISIEINPELVYVRGGADIGPAQLMLDKGGNSWRRPSHDAVVIRNRQGVTPPPTLLSQLSSDVALQLRLKKAVHVGGYGVNAALYGGLFLRQQRSQPWQAEGNIRLAEDAKVEAFGQQLRIVQGRLVFAGPVLRPEVLVDAVREVDGVMAGVRIQGRAPNPTVSLYADTPMSQQDMLSYLLLGRAPSEASAQGLSATDQQAMALGAALKLSGKTGVLEGLGESLGLSNLALDTQGRAEQTEVAITGRISPKLWLSYGRGIFQPTQSVTARYQINRRLSIEAYTAIESAVTVFYSWRF